MKLNTLLHLSLLSLLATLTSTTIAGASEAADSGVKETVIVAVKTDDVELHEMDISHLQPGDAETVFTEDGKTIDVLRTEDDVEIYINGKLLGTDVAAEGGHNVEYRVNKKIEIRCDDETECEELAWLEHGEEASQEQLHEDAKVYIIKKEVISQ